MKILFLFLTVLSVMLMTMFVLIDDTYHGALAGFAAAFSAMLVTMYNE